MGGVTEPGIVVAVETNAVWVEADRSAACGRCAARAGCGQGALSALLQKGKGRVRPLASETLHAACCQLGDEVMIEIPDSTLLGGTLWLYGAPLMLGTCVSMWAASWGDLWAASAFCLGLLSGFAILHQLSHRFQGVLPGMAEPRLASKTADPNLELLAKQ